jgi:hypothetical protein
MTRIATSFLSVLLVSNFAFAPEEGAAATANSPRLVEVAAAAFEAAPLQLEVEGPGALFTSIDAAAIDALAYAYLQARGACDPEFMRGGTIHPVGEGYYSYGEIHRANRWELHRISYILKPQDIARFHLYPVNRDAAVNRINERPSRVDLRSVNAIDPLHRPLYILHPSLAVRAYRGEDPQFVEVARLSRPAQPPRFARECSADAPSFGRSSSSNRVSETRRPIPRYWTGSAEPEISH